MKKLAIALVVALCAAGTAAAQENLGEIVVTGSRVAADDYFGMPAISIEKRADFLVQRVRLTNDTRLEASRREELYRTIRDMLADVGKTPGMALGFGEDFLIPITAKDHEIPLEPDRRRPDTTMTEFYIKRAIGADDDVASLLRSLRNFIQTARRNGRTEIEPLNEVALSMVNPDKYRYEIIEKIAADARKLQAAIGPQCRVDILGLAKRVAWERSDVSMLTLYIPYEVQLTGCQ